MLSLENTKYQYYPVNDYEEIDLRELILEIWANKWVIFFITLAFILVAAIYSFIIADRIYESRAQIYAPDFSLIDGSKITAGEYISFLYTPEIKRQLIDKYGLEINLANMDKKITVNTSNNSNNVVLKLKDTDRKLAAELLNDWVGLFTEKVRDYIAGYNSRYMDNLRDLMLTGEQQYLEAERKLTEFEASTNLGLTRDRLHNYNRRLLELENRAKNLSNDIIVLTEKEKILTELLQRTEKFIVTKEALEESSLKLLLDLLGESRINAVNIEKENINNLHISLTGQLNQVVLDLAVKKEEFKLLEQEIANLNNTLSALKHEVAILEEEERILKAEYTEVERNYWDIVYDYNSTVKTLQKRDYNIAVILEAVVPDIPVAPRKLFNLAIAGVLGVFVALFYVFMKNYFFDEKAGLKKA